MPGINRAHEMCMPERKLVVARVLYTHALPTHTKSKSLLALAFIVHVHDAFVLLPVCADVCLYHCPSL